ncbi:MAG: TonB-dependent receptor [Bryobacterales bacterium]|nr:TonB-dependent receptor [Bryobacterales bacterium]
MYIPSLLLLLVSSTLAAQTTGTLIGSVFDANTGRPIVGATIAIDGHSDSSQKTNPTGGFQLTLAPGKYKIRYTAENYVDTTVDDVEVKAGEVTDASAVMPLKGTTTTVEVVEKVGVVAANAEAALSERKLAAVVSDSMSAEEIRSTVASDAAGAMEKVTGVSIVDNGYVYVRGLGERYSATMLNNAMVPTTEPERRVVPLDLFPSSLIDSIKVLKTYSPDLPGEFSGGLVQLGTIEFPAQKVFRVSVNYGFNTVTSFNRFNGYSGGGLDFFGFEDGTRSLPSGIPTDNRLFVGRFTDPQFQEFGRSFANNWETAPINSMRPAQTYSVVGGNSFWKGKLGVVGAITFTNHPQRTDELQRFLVNSGGGQARIFTDYSDFQSNVEGAKLGGALNLAYRFNSSHKLVLRNTLTRDTDKEARVFRGLNGGNDNIVESTRLRYVERGMLSTGIEGEHAMAKLGNTVVHWQFTYATSKRDEPDMRESIRGLQANGSYAFLNLPESGLRFFNNLNDKIYEPQADLSKPFFKGPISGLLKVGFRGTIRRRDFEARRFRYFPVRAQTIDFSKPTNEVLGPNNIRPDGFVVREITRATDSYDATTDVYGGFAMVDLALGQRWRVISGVRVEDAQINVITLDPLVPNARPTAASLNNRDPLPAANLIYQVSGRQNFRFGYSRTVNRPDFRELSPFEFTNVVGGYSTVGNPDLQRAVINNFDVRWEYFPGGNQIVAVSYFYKKFKDPIEQIYRPTASELRQSFLNVDGAVNQGVELELRRSMSIFGPKMRQFMVGTNLTFVDSDVRIPVERFPQLTSRNRPLVGQSRFIYNIIAEWARPNWRSNARFYVNSVSRRLTDVGTFQLPDVYQERNNFLDFVYQYDIKENGKWSLRFTAENLTDNNYRWRQADFLVRSFRIGRTFTAGTSVSLF